MTIASVTSIVNGVVGDFLEESGNELATQMAFHNLKDGQPLSLVSIAQSIAASNCKRISILLHGLVADEVSWKFSSGDYSDEILDYGSLLQRDLPEDVMPLYLRYNTGLHISTNGCNFSQLMESLYQIIVRLNNERNDGSSTKHFVFVCHSMGGLVARSATYHAQQQGLHWVHMVQHIIFLGTPHGGSYWEKAGNVVHSALDAVPRPVTKLLANIANLRSDGIKDLRYGYILEEDWKDREESAGSEGNGQSNTSGTDKPKTQPTVVDLLEWISYHFVTGTVTSNSNHPLSLVFGDGLVSKASSRGRSLENEEESMEHSMKRQGSFREFAGVNHNGLQTNMQVYNQILAWIKQSSPERDNAVDHISSSIGRREGLLDQCQYLDDQSVQQLPGKWEKYSGACSLLQVAVDKGATAVQNVQEHIADEVYRVVGKIAPIAPVVTRIHKIHHLVCNAVFDVIRAVNHSSTESFKLVFRYMNTSEKCNGPFCEESSYATSRQRKDR